MQLPFANRRTKAGRWLAAFLWVTGAFGGVIVPCPAAAEERLSAGELLELPFERLLEVEVARVSGASRYEQKLSEAPASVTVVTSDEIGKHGYRTLAEILQSVRGFFVSYDRNYSYAGARGLSRPGDYNARILLLVDGNRINDGIYQMAPLGTDFVVDVDLIDRVEIIRGPSFSLYGSSAFLAVINVVTKRGRDYRWGEASAAAGSFSTYDARATVGKRWGNGLQLLASASYYDSKGQDLSFPEFDSPGAGTGRAKGMDGDWATRLLGKLSYGGLSLEGLYARRTKDLPTAPFESAFGAEGTFTTDERAFLDLKYEGHFSGRWDVNAHVFYNRYHYDARYMYLDEQTEESPFVYPTYDLSWSEWWGFDAQVVKEALGWHKILAGVELVDNFRLDQKSYDASGTWVDDRRTSRNWALYAQDEARLHDTLLLNAGLRYDYFDTFGGTVNPRVALIWNPLADTTLKLIYSRGFRAPNAYELYYTDGYGLRSNENLDEERVTGYEAVLEQRLGERLGGTLSAYRYVVTDLINQASDAADGSTTWKNLGEARARGLEAELAGSWPNGLKGRLSYVFQKTTDPGTGDELSNSPRHMAKLSLIVPLLREKLFLGFEERALSRRWTKGSGHAAGFATSSATLFSRNLLPGLDVSGSVYNLFDRQYGDPAGGGFVQDQIPQDGRTFRLKLTYRF